MYMTKGVSCWCYPRKHGHFSHPICPGHVLYTTGNCSIIFFKFFEFWTQPDTFLVHGEVETTIFLKVVAKEECYLQVKT